MTTETPAKSNGLSPTTRTRLRNIAAILLVTTLLAGIGYSVYSSLKTSSQNTQDFSISASPPVSTTPGSSQTSTLSIRSATGFTGQVTVQAKPSTGIDCHGVSGGSSTVVFVPGSWTLQCTASVQGNYPVDVVATTGTISRTLVVVFKFTSTVRNSSTMLVCSPSILVSNQTSTCRITIFDTSPGAKITPTGTVSLANSNQSSQILNCTLNVAGCTILFSTPDIGITRLEASYTGDKYHQPSQAQATITVRPESTNTAISCNPSTIVLQSAQTNCNVDVTSTTSGKQTTPTGTVMFTVSPGGTTSPSSCTLDNGSCSTQYSPASPGSYTITANYTGDNIHATSLGQFTISVTLASTIMSLACDPSTIVVNMTFSSCTITVKDTSSNPSSPTGEVQEKCSGKCAGDPAPTCPLVADGADSATCTFKITSMTPTQTMDVYTDYLGDSTHGPSNAKYTLTITSGPSTVTVSGRATTFDSCFGCKAIRLEFVNKNNGLVYNATVTNSAYTIPLANWQSYNVIMYWQDLLGRSSSCVAPSLNLHESQDTLKVNYRC